MRQGIGQEHRADEGAVVEEEAPEDGVRVGAWAQPLGPLLGPAPVADLAGAVGGKPTQAIPETASPVPAGRSGPPARGGIAIVREAAGDVLTGRIDPAEEPLQPVLPSDVRHAVLLSSLANAAGERRPTGTERRMSTEPALWAVRSTGWLGADGASEPQNAGSSPSAPGLHGWTTTIALERRDVPSTLPTLFPGAPVRQVGAARRGAVPRRPDTVAAPHGSSAWLLSVRRQ